MANTLCFYILKFGHYFANDYIVYQCLTLCVNAGTCRVPCETGPNLRHVTLMRTVPIHCTPLQNLPVFEFITLIIQICLNLHPHICKDCFFLQFIVYNWQKVHSVFFAVKMNWIWPVQTFCTGKILYWCKFLNDYKVWFDMMTLVDCNKW